MTANTPVGRGSAKKRRSMSDNFRNSVGNGAMPRPNSSLRTSRVASFRATTSQPQYDFLSGGEVPNNHIHHARPSSRRSNGAGGSVRATSCESSKENMAPPDAAHYETQRKQIEELKAELATVRFRDESQQRKHEIKILESENETRDAKRKAEEDFKLRQAVEAERNRVQRQLEALEKVVQESKESWDKEKDALYQKTQSSDAESRLLKEQLEELSATKDESERINQKRITDLQAQFSNLRQTSEGLEKDAQAKDTLLQQNQDQLSAKDKALGELEAENLRLKAQTGDADTIAVIRRELSDQVQHIRSLEAKNAKQHAELTHLRQVYKAVEVVEEEKRSLQRKLEVAESLETELAEARIQRKRLEDERLAWSSYLQSASESEGILEFDSPEDVARALVQERYNSASLVEKLGEVQPQISERDELIKSLEGEKSALHAQYEKLKTAAAPVSVSKAQARLERQRLLAVKEAEYLRAQLKTFDDEDETFDPENVDQQRKERISQLEQLVDEYKAEVEGLQKELSSVESTASKGVPQPAVGTKRKITEDVESEQIGELNRKRRKLADDLSKAQTELQVLQKENAVVQSRLQAAEARNKTRVLSLRSNPTSDWEAIKVATLTALKEENKQLLSQLKKAQPNPKFPVIPASQLAAAKREVEEAMKATASAEKKADRLKKVWSAKSQEFKEAIFSTLGWTVTFIPNGKMRVESLFYPSTTDENENSIVFDGERGTMKVSGGPQSAFARKIGDQIQFWVRDKGCIPGFLAALTLEFYEENARTSTLE